MVAPRISVSVARSPEARSRRALLRDEPHLGGGQLTKELVERRCAHPRRAAPTNRIRLWLRAIPSARFVLIGRRASSRSRRRRTGSGIRLGSRMRSGIAEILGHPLDGVRSEPCRESCQILALAGGSGKAGGILTWRPWRGTSGAQEGLVHGSNSADAQLGAAPPDPMPAPRHQWSKRLIARRAASGP
jgi:hypothetical protein